MDPARVTTDEERLALGLAQAFELEALRILADLVDHLARDPDGMRLLTQVLAADRGGQGHARHADAWPRRL